MKVLLIFATLLGLSLSAPSGNEEPSQRSGSLVFIPITYEELIGLFEYLNTGSEPDESLEDYPTILEDENDRDIPIKDELIQDGPDLSSNGLVQLRDKRSAKPEPFFFLARLFGFRRSRRFRRRRFFG